AIQELIRALAGEDIKPIADQRRRGVAFADGGLPFLRQRLGPGGRRSKAGDLAIAIGPAPLRPVLGESGCAEQNTRHDPQSSSMPMFHRMLPVRVVCGHGERRDGSRTFNAWSVAVIPAAIRGSGKEEAEERDWPMCRLVRE